MYETTTCNVFQDLIIEAIYADVIHGKLDQLNNQVLLVYFVIFTRKCLSVKFDVLGLFQLEVEYAIGRDITPENLNSTVRVLDEW